jgi:hypothetical protein
MTTGGREIIATEVREAVASEARAAIAIETDRTSAAEQLATLVMELATTKATQPNSTRPTKSSPEAATEIEAARAAGFHATAAGVSDAGGVGFPAPAELGTTNQPGAVWRVPLGVTTGDTARPASAAGYFDSAGCHAWPSSAGADNANGAL